VADDLGGFAWGATGRSMLEVGGWGERRASDGEGGRGLTLCYRGTGGGTEGGDRRGGAVRGGRYWG